MPKTDCITARFEDFEEFKKALRALKETGMRNYEAYGPTNLEEVQNLMPARGSNVRVWATVGAFVGLIVFELMCVISALIYGLIVGGKPPVANIPYVVPMYEGTILIGGIGAFIAILWYARLGLRGKSVKYDPRYSQDSYGIEVHSEERDRSHVTSILREAGAVEVKEEDK
jgi:hypothetical protein